MKKILALLALIMVITVGVMPFGKWNKGSFLAKAETSGDYKYQILDDGTIEITGYIGSDTEINIPNEIDGTKVTSIGEWAFEHCTTLKSVTISNGIKNIGKVSFIDCYSLTSITISNSVTNIGENAFDSCTKLKNITIPSSVTSIGKETFFLCRSLKSITVDTNNKNYSSQDGVLFNKNKTELIQYPIGNSRTSYVIPNSVTNIGDRAFSSCTKLTYVNIPNSVTNIENCAFYECTNLTSITIPNSVTSIEYRAFEQCTSLISVTMGTSVKSIGKGAFKYLGLKDVYYTGTKEEWNKVSISSDNDELKNATIHYNYHISKENNSENNLPIVLTIAGLLGIGAIISIIIVLIKKR